ncbi:hypothetical protein [Escherichia phage UPEC01]|nr:hypothetical protein [Escherichia phage UPEC01]
MLPWIVKYHLPLTSESLMLSRCNFILFSRVLVVNSVWDHYVIAPFGCTLLFKFYQAICQV